MNARTIFVLNFGLLALSLARPAAAQSLKVPFTLRDNKILIQATVNGQPAMLKLDSGSMTTVFNMKFAPPPKDTKKIELRTAVGVVEAVRGSARCEIGTFTFLLESTYLKPPSFGDDGVIGMDVLSQFKSITIDFRKKEIELVPFH